MADVLEDPLHAGIEHDLDWAALGRLFDDLGRGEDAIRFYRLALGGSLPPEIESQTRGRLAQLHKRRGEWDEAISQWVVSAARGEIPAYIELAKVYEHQRRAPSTALHWAQIALECVLGAGFPPAERALWEPELTHRIGRLQTKASG
jgi:tetratricopeptide (TPR) repeat protein